MNEIEEPTPARPAPSIGRPECDEHPPSNPVRGNDLRGNDRRDPKDRGHRTEVTAAEGHQPGLEPGYPGVRWIGGWIVLLATVVRALEAVQQGNLFNDGPRFVAMAEGFVAGDWRSALGGDSFHPLTSLLMAGLSQVTSISLDTSGQVISVAAGGLAAWAIWDLSRRLFGIRVSIAAGLTFALQPRLVASSSGIQSDGLHIALFLVGAWATWRMLCDRKARFALLAGVACGLAYLTRPEGLAIALILGGWLLGDRLVGRLSWRPTLGFGLAFGVCLVLISAPYVLALHELTGEWMLTGKKSVTGLLDLSWSLPARDLIESGVSAVRADFASPATAGLVQARFGGDLGSALLEVIKDGFHALQAPALILLLLGLNKGRPNRETRFLLSFVLLFGGLLLALRLEAGYVSRRHWLTMVALTTPFMGRGALRIFDSMLRISALRTRPLLRWIPVAIVVVAFVSHAAIPQIDAHKVARQKAALWVKSHTEPAVIAVQRSRDAYYAGAETFVELARPEDFGPEQEDPPTIILERARDQGARFMLIDDSLWPADRPLPDWAVEIHRAKHRGREVAVIEVRRPEPDRQEPE